MRIYLVRHGEAVEIGEQGVSVDEERVLSRAGRRKTRDVAAGLCAAKCRPERIVSSPLPRARETAEILAEALDAKARVETAAELAAGADSAQVVSWLCRQSESSIMLVGHMPDMASLAAALVCESGSLNILFKKAAACCISFEGSVCRGEGCLEWLLQPAQAKRMAGK
jgi:phosphohistidine phosphatase